MGIDHESIDLSDLEFWMRPLGERYEAFDLLRAEQPMPFFAEPEVDSPIPLPVGPGYFAVLGYDDVVTVSRTPELYCSGRGAISIIDLPPEMLELFSGLVSTDKPRHTRLRRIVSQAFNPRRIATIESQIAEEARLTVARARSKGSCDFVSEIAAPLPLAVICDMMGIPPGDRSMVLRCSKVILSARRSRLLRGGSAPR